LCAVGYLCIVLLHLCRHPRVFIRRTTRVLASQNLVSYESQKSAREIRNRFKMERGSRRGAIGFLQPSPETGEPIHGKRTALPPVTEEPIKVNDPLFTAVTVRPKPKSNQLFRPRPEREPIGSLPDRQKEATRPQGLDLDFDGPFTRMSRARALRPKPEPGPARQGERARACVLPSSSHPHLQEHGEHPTI
jgi:hypothetical protein